jgi:intracellular multiplication protein IcmL
LNWAAEAASAAYTYDQAHYKTQLVEVINHYFTPSGGESFQKALEESGILEQLVSQQLLVTAVVQNKPILLKSGILLGRESWKVQLPLLVTYQTASQVQQNRFIVTMMIVRTDTSQDPRGIGIDQIWVQRA